jgi:hypothetical protein
VLGGEEARDVLAALVDEVANLEEEVEALRERHRAPRRESLLRGRDSGVDLLHRGEIDRPALLARGGVVDGSGAS